MRQYILVLAAVALMMGACGQSGFKVTGSVEGGSDTVEMVIESSNSGWWFIVDSVKTSGSGSFSVTEPAPAVPTIYRLRWKDKSIYFPIDSIEEINISTSVGAFGTVFELSGSDNALLTMAIDKRAAQLGMLPPAEYAAQAEAYKKELSRQILADPSGIVAYYAINKYIGGKPLFDPLVDFDFKVIGAVANAFNSFRPDDPRTAYLVRTLKQGLVDRRTATASDTVYVEESSLINIELQDNYGVTRSLAEETQHGNVVILNFTVLSADFSPAFNRALADVYTKYAKRGIEIFQVGLDDDSFAWQDAVGSLPWISVYDPMGSDSNLIYTYNVTQVPLVYIIDRSGEIVERVTDYTQLDAVVAKYL